MMFSVSMVIFSGFTFAAPSQGEDIVKMLVGGSLGKSLGKDGMIWVVLTAVTLLCGAFWAAIKHDPKAFIPAFITAGIISTIVGVFITF
ncbi:hypothetical protein [Legionella santicrucis]|nr:hypothetical protein [Legionella santicrucis]